METKFMQENALLRNLTSEESENIRGGHSDPPYPWLPAEESGYKLALRAKCNVDEIIGPDGECYQYLSQKTLAKKRI